MNIKKTILSSLALLMCLFASAQQNATDLVIANKEIHVLYRGYANKLEIAAAGYQNSALVVTSDDASITRDGDSWICKVTSQKSEITINVSAKEGDQVKSIGSQTFQVRFLPNPQAYVKLADGTLWNPDKGSIDKSQFEGASVVVCFGNEVLDSYLTIKSFKLAFPDGRGGVVFVPSDGNKFSASQIKYINSMKSGDAISLVKIEYTGAKTGNNLPFAPLTLK